MLLWQLLSLSPNDFLDGLGSRQWPLQLSNQDGSAPRGDKLFCSELGQSKQYSSQSTREIMSNTVPRGTVFEMLVPTCWKMKPLGLNMNQLQPMDRPTVYTSLSYHNHLKIRKPTEVIRPASVELHKPTNQICVNVAYQRIGSWNVWGHWMDHGVLFFGWQLGAIGSILTSWSSSSSSVVWLWGYTRMWYKTSRPLLRFWSWLDSRRYTAMI